MEAILASLQETPVPAPDAPGVPTVLDGGTARALVFSALYSTSAWPGLAEGLVAAEEGDGSRLLGAPPQDAPPPEPPAEPEEIPYDNFIEARSAVLCTDSPTDVSPERWGRVVRRLQDISPTGAGAVGWAVGLPCASWPAEAANRYTGPWGAATASPLLLVGVTADPITPLASARRLDRLTGASGVLLEHRGYGHTSFGQPSSCTLGVQAAYLVDGVLPGPGAVCLPDAAPFAPPPAPPGGDDDAARSSAPGQAAGDAERAREETLQRAARELPYPVPRPAAVATTR